jgi:hypothetical protein
MSAPDVDAVALHGLDEAGLDRASNGDRSWFKRHADRAHRIRPARDGELPTWERPAGSGGLIAVVAQVKPGTRLRIYTRLTAIPSGCEACARDLWTGLAGQRGGEAKMTQAAMGLWS